MRLRSIVFASFLAIVACSSSSPSATDSTDAAPPPDVPVDGGSGEDAGGSIDAQGSDASPAGPTTRLRVMAANTTSGAGTSYDPIESVRLFQGLHPDVVVVQELKYGDGSDAALRELVTTAFGASYTYYREVAGDIPNGVISRHPILDSGTWDDPNVDNRGFVWAKIQVPDAPHALWAVSLHLLTSSASNRDAEAKALVAQVQATVPAADYLVVGGDFNTSVRTEPCIDTLSAIVETSAPYPDDGAGNDNTNSPRSKPHDWLLADADLGAYAVPVAIGARTFPAGLVFDSRIYQPLADVAPIVATDSDAANMQHMPVVRDFAFPR